MHVYLKQLAPCIGVCEKIEGELMHRRIMLPETQFSAAAESLLFSHQLYRGDRAVYWGISGSLKPQAHSREDQLHVFFFIQFYNRKGPVVKLAYHPTRDLWGSDVTMEELKILKDAIDTEESDPDRLAREIRAGNLSDDQFAQELPTKEAIKVVSIMAKWLVDMDNERPSRTFPSSSRRPR